MTHASELYDTNSSWGWGSYEPIVQSFGNVAVEVTCNDYQGDTWVLYHEADGRFGHLIFGWGSCSGCDALQACDTIDEVEELRKQFELSIKWFDSAEEALKWFEDHDWKGDWSYHYAEQTEYIEKSIKYIKKQI